MFKFRAIAGHPAPGNAGRGFSYAADYPVSDTIKKTRGEESFVQKNSTDQDCEVLLRKICSEVNWDLNEIEF